MQKNDLEIEFQGWDEVRKKKWRASSCSEIWNEELHLREECFLHDGI